MTESVEYTHQEITEESTFQHVGGVADNGRPNVADPAEHPVDTSHSSARDDSSQDPDQPAVGVAVQFDQMIVPDDEDVTDVDVPSETGEVIDARRESETAGQS